MKKYMFIYYVLIFAVIIASVSLIYFKDINVGLAIQPCTGESCTSEKICDPSWNCSAWSICENSSKTRFCKQTNNCTDDAAFYERQRCEPVLSESLIKEGKKDDVKLNIDIMTVVILISLLAGPVILIAALKKIFSKKDPGNKRAQEYTSKVLKIIHWYRAKGATSQYIYATLKKMNVPDQYIRYCLNVSYKNAGRSAMPSTAPSNTTAKK